MKADTSNLKLDSQTLGVYYARARRARAEAMQNLALRLINWVSARFAGSGRHRLGMKWG